MLNLNVNIIDAFGWSECSTANVLDIINNSQPSVAVPCALVLDENECFNDGLGRYRGWIWNAGVTFSAVAFLVD